MIKNLKVQPHWGAGQLVVSWETSDEPDPEHNVIVLSSIDGESWVNVTGQGDMDAQSGSFIHKEPLSMRRSNELFYRVVIQTDGERWDSPSVSAQQLLAPHEFAAVRQILSQEHHAMRVGEGVEVLLLKPLTFGEPADTYDEATGQIIGGDVDESGYGERFKNGYFPPVKTLMTFVNQQDKQDHDSQGKGVSEVSKITARAFCFPRPQRNDLVVNPANDERFTVGQIRTHRFKGIIPVMCDIELDVLPRGDVRYKLNPDNVPDPYTT